MDNTKTTAQIISSLLGDDGQNFQDADDRWLVDIAEEMGATVSRDGDRDMCDTSTRYDFSDGSAIVVMAGNAWDVA